MNTTNDQVPPPFVKESLPFGLFVSEHIGKFFIGLVIVVSGILIAVGELTDNRDVAYAGYGIPCFMFLVLGGIFIKLNFSFFGRSTSVFR